MKKSITALLLLSGFATTPTPAQDFTLNLNNLNCEIPLSGPVNFESDAAGNITFVTTTQGTTIPSECPGAGSSVELSTTPVGPVDPNDSVTVNWTVPAAGSTCTLLRNGAVFRTDAQLDKPSGSLTDSLSFGLDYRMECVNTVAQGSAGSFAVAGVDVNGATACGSTPPHGATRETQFRYRLNNPSPTNPLRMADTFEEAFGAWPGATSAGQTFFPLLGRNRFVSLPFVPDQNGTSFVIINYEEATGSTAADSMQVSVSSCVGGFKPADALCSFVIDTRAGATISKSACNLSDNEQYYLNFVWSDTDDGAGTNPCNSTDCQWVMSVTGF